MPTATRSSVSEAVHDTVPAIFQQAQHSVASHKKNVVQLHKIQLQAAAYTEPTPKGPRLVGERTFNNQFLGVLKNILPLKKGTTVADRIVKFVGAFVHFIVEKVPEEKQKESETIADDDSPAERFIEDLLKFLLKCSPAKDRHVRYRSVQVIAEIVSSIGELDDDLYADLRSSLLERVQDKEASIRTQAVIALSKLQRGEKAIEMGSDEVPLVEVLAEVLKLDPSAEVRKVVALNIPPTDLTIDALVSRTRDVDDAVRRVIYHHCLPQIPLPRHFSIAQREQILRNGLGDRDETVKTSAAKLIGQWVDLFDGNLLEYLDTFELVSGTEVAEDALKALFKHRPDVLDSIKFEDSYWTELLTPEKAFLARVFADYCVTTKDESRMESTLPVVTTLAFRIQLAYNHLIKCHQRHGDDRDPIESVEEQSKTEDEILDYVFVVGELFKLALNMDYADEIGRRKMFALVGEMIRQEALPESLIPGCLDILAKLSPSERDFIRLMVENIQSMRDIGVSVDEEMPPADDETDIGDTPARRLFAPPPEKSDEEKARIAITDRRCLTLCIGMLERVMGTFDENPTLEAVLRELVLPAVQTKEVVIRERGLTALGLCCMIHKKMALGSFNLFVGQAEKAALSLRVKALQAMFDMMMLSPNDLLHAKNGEQTQEDLIVEFLTGILQENTPETQTVICVGLAKLLLAGIITKPFILKTLVILYFAPETSSNQELRQCLTYFFPVYCFSSSVNQRKVLEILLPVYVLLLDAYTNLSEGEEMITPELMLGHLVDWTDPEKVIVVENMPRDEEVHLDLAILMVKALFDAEVQAADKKLFCQTLSRLYLPDGVDENKLRTLKFLMNSFKQNRHFPDTTTKNAFERFNKLLEKKYVEQLKSMTEEESRKMVELNELFEFLDQICPEDTIEEPGPKKRVTRARKSDESSAKKRSKRKRGDITDTGDETSTQTSVASASPPARRPKSTRAAATRARTRSVSVISVEDTDVDSVDTDIEESYEKSSEDGAPKHKAPKRRKQEPETAEEIDADIELILSGRIGGKRGAPAATRLRFGTASDHDSDIGSEADVTVRPGGDGEDSEGEVAEGLLEYTDEE